MKLRRIIPAVMLFGYLLGIQDGYIALWKDGNSKPMVSPYRAALLPQEDQQRLKNGIRVENKEELARLVEDYLS